MMKLYYLTEMNMLKLENKLLQFIVNNNIGKTLINGLIAKLSAMMYKQRIDYYYPDAIATTLNVDIKHVDIVYLYGHDDLYRKTLPELLKDCDLYDGNIADAAALEENINSILKTRKPIQTRKIKRKWRK